MVEFNAMQVEKHGSGFSVTLRVWVPANDMPSEYEDVLACISHMMARQADTGLAEGAGTVSRDTAAEENPTPRRRGRPRKDDTEATASGPESTTAEEAAPARRRRASSASTSTEPTEARSASGRRRRRGAAPEGEQSASPTESAPSAGRRRGRTSGSAASSAETTSPSSDVTDEDLTKAASQAVPVLGPERIIEILEEFGVSTVGALTGESRQEFLNQLQASVDEEEGR
jgi:hypothetical protein